MTERTYEVKTVKVGYLCDKCGDGMMEQTGIMLLTAPPQWPHKCNRCGEMQNLWRKYPTVRWEECLGGDANMELTGAACHERK